MNFDEHVDRTQYPTMKWSHDFLSEHFGNPDAIPLSVADMDIKSPSLMVEQIQKRVAHGVFGYEYKADSYFAAVESWYQNRHGWNIDQQHIESCPSILNAIAILINQHSAVGDGIIVQSPVFFEFRMVIRSNKRRIVKNPLTLTAGRYEIDFEDLETKAANPKNKILILCNPHNPVGRVWTRAELEQIASICTRHGVFVIADEIHGDFAFAPHRYTPYLTVSDGAAQHAVACLSPAKTFNIAGMVDAITVIPDAEHRDLFHDFAHRYQINKINVLSSVAIETAYNTGAEWLDALLVYLQGNIDLMRTRFSAEISNVSLIEPEGTFLLWLDFRKLGLDAKELERFLAHDANLALSPGYWFGREGAGFARMTIGAPRATIQHALDNLAAAVAGLA
jgi:cystathionine beta-lyase